MKTLTEREAVLRERAAYIAAREATHATIQTGCGCVGCDEVRMQIRGDAALRYPTPPPPPREVTVQWTNGKRVSYRVVNGELQGKGPGGYKFSKAYHTVETIKQLADLIANPNEREDAA